MASKGGAPSRVRTLARAAAIVALCFLRSRDVLGRPFVAFASDFAGFSTWRSWSPSFGVIGNDHLNGPRRIYFSDEPIGNAFPVGTMIVKETHTDRLATERQIFAMVKRGAAFNAEGASGWEWFELENIGQGRVRIVWRGTGPTNGDAYGGDPTGGCNSCHGLAEPFDYVYSLEVRMLSRGEKPR